MTVSALALFGSHARGDAKPDSDIDILAVTSDTRRKVSEQEDINVTRYPRELLIRAAVKGDLFVLHLVREATFFYDPHQVEVDLKKAFRYQRSYRAVARSAADVAWFLCHFGPSYKDRTFVNKRAAWCVRTILIAASADRGEPVFSAKALARLDQGKYAAALIKAKDRASYSERNVLALRTFLTDNEFPSRLTAKSSVAYLNAFKRTKNSVGVATVRRLHVEEQAPPGY